MKQLFKKSMTVVLSILLLSSAACQKGIADKDGNMWNYSLKEAQEQEGYFVRIKDGDSAVYQPLLQPSEAGYVSFKNNSQAERYILMCNKDKLIPIITGDNLLVYIDDDQKIPEIFTLESYEDAGYTFGGFFMTKDNETGMRIKSNSFISGSSMKNQWGKKDNLSLYILDNIGGFQIGKKNLDENGIFQGLEVGKKYEFSCFVGTKYDTVTVMCDTHYYKAGRAYTLRQKDCISLTTNGFAILNLPPYLPSGFYLLNDTYYFYYDAENVNKASADERFETTQATESTVKSTVLNRELITDGDSQEDYELPGD